MRLTDLAHLIVRKAVKPGDWAIDATVGNGHDTAMLADAVGPTGRVFGFDVQLAAITATAQRVEAFQNVTLIHDGHERMIELLPAAAAGRIAAVMFNLGYLPGGQKTIITRTESTLAALDAALQLVRVGGVITVALYCGHPGGAEEAEAVRQFAKCLPHQFFLTDHSSQGTKGLAPELLAIERINAENTAHF